MHAIDLKIPPVALFLVCAAGMWSISSVFPDAAFTFSFAAIFAVPFASIGLPIALAAGVAFRRQSTTVNPMKPETTTAVVCTGIYRFTRNPMYLGLALGLVAWVMYLENAGALLLIPAFVAYMTEFQIKPEERALLRKFGFEYADYMATVRRWL